MRSDLSAAYMAAFNASRSLPSFCSTSRIRTFTCSTSGCGLRHSLRCFPSGVSMTYSTSRGSAAAVTTFSGGTRQATRSSRSTSSRRRRWSGVYKSILFRTRMIGLCTVANVERAARFRFVQVRVRDEQNQVGLLSGLSSHFRPILPSHFVQSGRVDQDHVRVGQAGNAIARTVPRHLPNLFGPTSLDVDFRHRLSDQRVDQSGLAGADFSENGDFHPSTGQLDQHFLHLRQLSAQSPLLVRRTAGQLLDRPFNGCLRTPEGLFAYDSWFIHGRIPTSLRGGVHVAPRVPSCYSSSTAAVPRFLAAFSSLRNSSARVTRCHSRRARLARPPSGCCISFLK